jgi:GntR family transcriptional regulator
LHLAIGKPILLTRQIFLGDFDKPLFASTIRYHGERYRLRTFLARSNAIFGQRRLGESPV